MRGDGTGTGAFPDWRKFRKLIGCLHASRCRNSDVRTREIRAHRGVGCVEILKMGIRWKHLPLAAHPEVTRYMSK